MIYLEIFLIAVIVLIQIILFVHNGKKLSGLEAYYPERRSLSLVQKTAEQEAGGRIYSYKVDQIAVSRLPQAFKQVLEDTNTYLLHNKGSAASFGMLKEIAERPYKLRSSMASAGITTPLYLGLAGSVLGAGLSLVPLIKGGLSDAAVKTFLTGLIIAMVSSLIGLLLTLLGKYQFRQAKQWADEREQEYFSFLQLSLLPRLEQDMAGSLSNLRGVLEEFNNDFFRKIVDFKDVFANLSNYVGVQEKFLTALENSGFTSLTEANFRFLEKIRENEDLFESFGGYQKKLNESLQLGAEAARDIRLVVERLRHIDDIQAYIRQNEEMIRKQLGYLTAHQDRLEDLSHGIQQHFVEAGDEIGKIVQERLQVMKKEEQDAGEALRDHFSRLQEENVYQKIAEQLQPIKRMKEEVDQLSRDTLENSKVLLETSEYLVKKINQDGRLHGALLGEIKELNQHMAQLNEPKSWWQQLTGKGGRNTKRK